MVCYRFTAKVLRVLESTSKPYRASRHTNKNSPENSREPLKNRARGNYFEELALEFFKKKNLTVRLRNHRVWGVEHDFIVSNNFGEIIFVEVKSLSHIDDLHWRIKASQKKRLLRSAQAFLQGNSAKSLGVWLLAIEDGGRTHFLPLRDDS